MGFLDKSGLNYYHSKVAALINDTANDIREDVDDLKNIVEVSSEQPTEEENKLWINTGSSSEIEIPTYGEFDELKEDVNDLIDEINDLNGAIENLEEGSLSALGADAGQLPTADGAGSWVWETPEFVRTVNSQSNPIMIPEVNDNTTSQTDVWSSNKVSSELSDKQGKVITDTGGYFSTDTVESALQTLGAAMPITETISSPAPAIIAEANHRYICGEVSTISITPPANGIIDVIFESGSTPAVLTVPNTVKWPDLFDAANLESNATYEINIMNGTLGAVGKWT